MPVGILGESLEQAFCSLFMVCRHTPTKYCVDFSQEEYFLIVGDSCVLASHYKNWLYCSIWFIKLCSLMLHGLQINTLKFLAPRFLVPQWVNSWGTCMSILSLVFGLGRPSGVGQPGRLTWMSIAVSRIPQLQRRIARIILHLQNVIPYFQPPCISEMDAPAFQSCTLGNTVWFQNPMLKFYSFGDRLQILFFGWEVYFCSLASAFIL